MQRRNKVEDINFDRSLLSRVTKMLGVMIGLSIVMPVFAQSAPVYDADAMRPEQETIIATDQSQYYAPPPAPEQDTGGTFVSMSQQPAAPAVAAKPSASLNMDQRIQRVEQQVSTMQSKESASRVDSLQEQVQTLRGQIEQLTRQLEQVQNQQKSLLTDVDNRLAQAAQPQPRNLAQTTKLAKPVPPAADTPDEPADTSWATAAVVTKTTKQTSVKPLANKAKTNNDTIVKIVDSQPNAVEEQQIYQTAYNYIKVKKYSEAVNALQGMLKRYPAGQFASNAHYWLGELYGLMGKNDEALSEFNTVVQNYADSPRISDAQLKLGLILASELKWQEAKVALKKVVTRYPDTASARLASEQLKQIKQAGH